MATADEAMIQQLLDELVDAWKRGDTKAYGARFLADATVRGDDGGRGIGAIDDDDDVGVLLLD